MAAFGPKFATGAAAGFNAQTLTEKLLQQQLQNAGSQGELADAQKRRMAQAMIGQAMQRATGRVPQIPLLTAPAQGAPAQPIVQPAEGGAPAGGAPGPRNVTQTPLPPLGAGGASAGGGVAGPNVNAGPASAEATAEPEPEKEFSWRDVAKTLRSMRGSDPETIALAIEMLTPQLKAEEDREFKAREGDANRELKLQQHIDNLKWKYANTDSQEERVKIKGQIDTAIASMNNDTKLGVASMNNATNLEIAGARTASAERIALANNTSRETIADHKLAWQKEYGNGVLDLRADAQAKNFITKTRELELRDKGLNQKQAQFYAKLEQDKTLAEARNDVARRGQDLMVQRAQMAAQGKLDVTKEKLNTAMMASVDEFDALYKDAEALLGMPGLDNATGPIDQYLLSIQGDTVNFEKAVQSLKAKVGFAALMNMRRMSPTGGALGNVSNKEVEFLQNSITSLDLGQTSEQFIENLRKIMDYANSGKTKLLDAYERQNSTGPAASPGSPAVTQAEAAPTDPAKRVIGKSYKSPNGQIGIWTAQGWQLVTPNGQ